ncbi:SDR family oxidoreductase [Rhizobium leucaenae]|uniref:SDR family oxidoreductase n=1 Tax=Rhizobium leucaenae TaxID=29450 RepID=UPI00161F5403|nr:SDR family NAD(P)-dependent oxidoreductase [Rhizobium leucaenae]MBB6304822.1 NAD(P)-dependent dehydrogenase (short-subunit alcohol dehydrogenase family) [Rhizobium leucaenae]
MIPGTIFADRVAVVTGASSGIGKAIANALVAAGVSVHALSRRPIGDGADGNRGGLVWHKVDLAKDAEVIAFSEHLLSKGRELDFLVHCAGLFATGDVATTDVEQFDKQLMLNLRAPYVLTRALLPLLIRRAGQIAFINSSVWNNPRAGLSGYIASKYGLKAFADVLRAEVSPQGVRVVSFFPGRTATPMQEEIFRKENLDYDPESLLQPEAIASSLLDAFALPPSAEITDIFIRPAKPKALK